MIMFKQAGILFAPPSQVNETLIWVAGGLIGAPGLLQLWQARSGTATPTAVSSPPDPSPESSPSSSGGA